jgi:hypothetical protein
MSLTSDWRFMKLSLLTRQANAADGNIAHLLFAPKRLDPSRRAVTVNR